MRSTKAVQAILVLAAALALAGGCGESIVDGHTRPALMDINEGMTLQADVFVSDTTMVGGGFIPEEGVTVTFSNQPSQQFLNLQANDPYGTFVLTEYTIVYEVLHRLPTGAFFSSGTLPPVSGAMHLEIPVNQQVETFLIVMPAALKYQAPISDILPGGQVPYGELILRAEMTFAGNESGDDRVRLIEGALTVYVANYGDEDN